MSREEQDPTIAMLEAELELFGGPNNHTHGDEPTAPAKDGIPTNNLVFKRNADGRMVAEFVDLPE